MDLVTILNEKRVMSVFVVIFAIYNLIYKGLRLLAGSDRLAPTTAWRAVINASDWSCVGSIPRPRPPRGALSAGVASTAPASDGHGPKPRGRRESHHHLHWKAGRGGGDGRALGRQVEVGVQSSTGGPKPRVV